MAENTTRKSVFIFALALSLVAALFAILLDEELREKLGTTYYVLSMAIIGSILIVLAGYAWDRALIDRLKALRQKVEIPVEDGQAGETDHDEIIGLARNIERMARTLQRSEASYRGIVEDQVDLICRFRMDGQLTFVNRAYADALGRKRNDLIGQLFPYFDQAGPIGLETVTFEQDLKLQSGTTAWFMWTRRAIKDDTGQTLEFQAVGHNITLRKDAEAALLQAKETAEAADRAKSEFLAIVSHEIRTPINGVVGFAEILADSPLTLEQREQVEIIRSSGKTLEKLINDILDLSKIDAGKIEIESSPFGLHKCLEDTASFFQPRARSTGLTLTTEIDADVPAIANSDEARIRQILTNLIANALKFTERGGIRVHLSCLRGAPLDPHNNRRELRLFFAVSDTGIGIPLDKMAQLFKPFSQVDHSAQRRRSGTGLGLIISKRLCELMGGSISVDSTAGQGSTFRFSILTDYEVGDTKLPFALRPAPGYSS
jgi:PAS domain S-box-containing protein